MSEKNRLVMICPCCGGEVTHRRYGFDVLCPPELSTWYVCDGCEAALKGDDPVARKAAEQAFIRHLEEKAKHAPAA